MTEATATVVCPACGAVNLPGSRFCSTCATPLGEAVAPATETRKVVSVLFIDATSSTALGERLDPESLRAVMTRYFEVMREVIEFHGGSVEKFIGDAVMAVFGVPTLHEDDALRACRAALEIRDRLGELDAALRSERGATVEWRMGINTGEVVAGDAASGQRIVTGDAVNVAARLESAAAPGEIFIGADTHELVRGSVSAGALDPLSLKGKGEPVAAWRLDAILDATGRHVRPLGAPLVGRRRPLRLLDEAFRDTVEERVCHLFTVLGTAGVGKSRLVDEFVETLGDQAQVVTGRCLAYGQGITYWPVAEAIRAGIGIAERDPPEAARSRLSEVLAEEPERDRIIAVLGCVLNVAEECPAPEELSWAIRKTFEAMARRRPLVLVFDDIHWGERTFLDLVDHVADWTRDAPILLIAMARPELLERRPTWGGGKRWVTTIQLEPLSDSESDELVTGLLGTAKLPAEFKAQISHAAEGNPLFVEELLGKLIDDGFLARTDDGWAAIGDLERLAIPPTIQALLAARLDGLGSEERAVIERASVEGKVFHRGAVTELAPEPMRPQVRERLASLMRMELVRPDQASFAGEEAFQFRHLLIRDAAYQALAKQTRSELHERFADWLARVAVDRLAEYEEIIGYHLEQAYRYRIELGAPDAHATTLADRAAEVLAAAGERAWDRADVHAATDLLGRVVDLMAPNSARRWILATRLAGALYAGGEGRRAAALLEEVLARTEVQGDAGTRARAELMLLEIQGARESLEASLVIERATALRTLLEDLADAEGAYAASSLIAMHNFFAGRAGAAARQLEALMEEAAGAGLSVGRPAAWLSAIYHWGPTPVPEAMARIEALVERAPTPLAGTLLKRYLGGLRAMNGEFEEGRRMLAEATAAAVELGNRYQVNSIDGMHGGTLEVLAGDYQRAVGLIEASYRSLSAAGDVAFAATTASNLAAALLEAGRDDDAWRYATVARETSAADDVSAQCDGARIMAVVLARRGELEEAERLARETVTTVDGTDYLQMRGDVHASLAHVLHAAGKGDEALAEARSALENYERKGVLPSVARTKALIAEWGG